MTDRSTHRWYGVAAIAFFAAAAGVLARQPALLLASVVGVGFAAYARAAGPPAVSLELDRKLADEAPDPGETVAVTVRVTNTGDALLDLRLIDGVPGPIEVTGGSPRLGTALRAGKTAEFNYEIEAARGVHEFGPLTAIARDPSGAVEREIAVAEPTTFTCLPRLEAPATAVPVRQQTGRYTGAVPAATGGSGIEFHATREYRHGDPLSRVDWNRLARTGEPTTIQLREELQATVVIVVDARESAYTGGEDHGLERSVRATGRLFAGLLDDGHRVGIAAIGVTDCWLDPATGTDHRVRARRLLATHPALSPTPPDRSVVVTLRLDEIRRRLPAASQVILVTPLIDEFIVNASRRLDASGNAVSVLSPDVTDDETPGRTLAGIERRARIATLRNRSIPVIDWPRDEDLDYSLAAALERTR